MSSNLLFQAVIGNHVAPFLKNLGFSREENWFYKVHGDVVWRIALSLITKPSSASSRITVYIGVGFKSLAQIISKSQILKVDNLDKPTAFAANIGRMMPKCKYHTWPLSSELEIDYVGQIIVDAIFQYGLSFFEKYGTLSKAIYYWERGETESLGIDVDYYLAGAYALQDNNTYRACAYLRNKVNAYIKIYKEKGKTIDNRKAKDREAFIGFLRNLQLQ